MLTLEQALTAEHFHEGASDGCIIVIGPGGGVTHNTRTWRRNGQTHTSARNNSWRIPVVRGLKSYASIYDTDADNFHVPADCVPHIIDNRPPDKQRRCPICAQSHFTVGECRLHIALKHHKRD